MIRANCFKTQLQSNMIDHYEGFFKVTFNEHGYMRQLMMGYRALFAWSM